MEGLIIFIGLLVMGLIVVIALEYLPVKFSFSKNKSISEALNDVEQAPEEAGVSGIRKTLHPLEAPTQKYAPPKLLKKIKYELYWGQMDGKYVGWTALQFLTLQLFLAICGAIVGSVVFGNAIFAVVIAFMGWQYPMAGVSGSAKKIRSQFQGQLPEYIQMVSAQMAAGISFEESVRRTTRSESLPAIWMRNVLRMAQGRNLIGQIQREAFDSQLPELITMGIQLGYLNKGAQQQKLLDDLEEQISAAYISQVNIKAEKIGGDLVLPMILFYFIPFLIIVLVVIAYPMVSMVKN